MPKKCSKFKGGANITIPPQGRNPGEYTPGHWTNEGYVQPTKEADYTYGDVININKNDVKTYQQRQRDFEGNLVDSKTGALLQALPQYVDTADDLKLLGEAVGDALKKRFTTPSGILETLGVLAGPLAGAPLLVTKALTTASTIASLAGHGIKEKPKPNQCRGITKNGVRCKALIQFCKWH